MIANGAREVAVAGYRKVVALREPGLPSALLHMSGEETWLLMGASEEPVVAAQLRVGLRKSVRDFFRHDRIDALGVERAIAGLEEEIMKLAPLVLRAASLYTADPVAFDIAAMSGVSLTAMTELSRQALEITFEGWVRATLGYAGPRDTTLQSRELAAGILILREVLHHLYFEGVTIVGSFGSDLAPGSGQRSEVASSANPRARVAVR
jgi:hypothetical protein